MSLQQYRLCQSKSLTVKSRKKKGFTLVELLVVMAIIAMVSASISAGIIYLSNAIKLDYAIYQVKGYVQNTQNLARNSFSEEIDNGNRFNIGWIVEITGHTTSRDLEITRIPVYGTIPNDVPINELAGLKDVISKEFGNKDIYCNSSTLKKDGRDLTSINLNNTTKKLLDGIECGSEITANDDETLQEFDQGAGGVILSSSAPSGVNAPINCYANGKASIFFTAGYGEVSYVGAGGSGNNACQIILRNKGTFGRNYNGIRIDKRTGTVKICGQECTV